MLHLPAKKNIRTFTAQPVWALVAAFGAYFCMYGFRKPYPAATYSGAFYFGIDYKFLLVIAQTAGYVMAKWAGIKIISEIKPGQRISMLIGLILLAELMLLCFGFVPRPWNIVCLLLNGLFLGIVFGLVLGFLEGRKNTEAMIAGLCASFIVSDGVSKSVGSLLLGTPVASNTTYLKKIFFKYPDQKAFPDKADYNYDCEAIFFADNHFQFLSKDRSDTYTKLYRLDQEKTEEVNALTLIDKFNIGGKVTAADASQDGNRIVVITYAAIWMFERTSSTGSYFKGNIWWLPVKAPQIESVCFKDVQTLWLLDEITAQLYEVSTDKLIKIK